MACTTSTYNIDIPFTVKPPEGVPEMPENVPDFEPDTTCASPSSTSHTSIELSRHPYAENSYLLDHFTGRLLVSREDLAELYRQLDDYLYPNPGYAPRIAEGTDG